MFFFEVERWSLFSFRLASPVGGYRETTREAYVEGSLAGFVTTQEAAGLLRLSPRTLERHRVQGTGPRYMKVGPGKRARVLYAVEDLNDWIGHKYGGTSEYRSANGGRGHE